MGAQIPYDPKVPQVGGRGSEQALVSPAPSWAAWGQSLVSPTAGAQGTVQTGALHTLGGRAVETRGAWHLKPMASLLLLWGSAALLLHLLESPHERSTGLCVEWGLLPWAKGLAMQGRAEQSWMFSLLLCSHLNVWFLQGLFSLPRKYPNWRDSPLH